MWAAKAAISLQIDANHLENDQAKQVAIIVKLNNEFLK